MFGIKGIGPSETTDDAPERKIRYLGDLQRLELRDGDRFVLTSERPLSVEQVKTIQKQWKAFVGDTNKFRLLVLDSGLKLGVVSVPAKA